MDADGERLTHGPISHSVMAPLCCSSARRALGQRYLLKKGRDLVGKSDPLEASRLGPVGKYRSPEGKLGARTLEAKGTQYEGKVVTPSQAE